MQTDSCHADRTQLACQILRSQNVAVRRPPPSIPVSGALADARRNEEPEPHRIAPSLPPNLHPQKQAHRDPVTRGSPSPSLHSESPSLTVRGSRTRPRALSARRPLCARPAHRPSAPSTGPTASRHVHRRASAIQKRDRARHAVATNLPLSWARVRPCGTNPV
jgi:hypothetical protein